MACTESAPTSTPLPSVAPSEPTATPPPVATPTLQPTPTPRPTATPRPTLTPILTATPAPTPLPGTSRGNPVPVGVSVEVTSESSWNEGRAFEVAVVQTIRGSEALHALLIYDEPELGHEWILVRMQIRYIFGKGAASKIRREIKIFSSLGSTYDHKIAVEPEPDIDDIMLFPGAAQEGWIAWQIGINDPHPLLLFGANYLYRGGVWLNIDSAGLPSATPTPISSATSVSEWAFDTIGPTTDARIAYAYVEDSPYSLYIRCGSDQLDMFVVWGRSITSNPTVPVIHKAGNQPTKRLSWDLSGDGEATFVPANMLESTIQQMYGANEFVVSVQPDQESTLLTATFGMHGMYEAVQPVLEACPQPTATPAPQEPAVLLTIERELHRLTQTVAYPWYSSSTPRTSLVADWNNELRRLLGGIETFLRTADPQSEAHRTASEYRVDVTRLIHQASDYTSPTATATTA